MVLQPVLLPPQALLPCLVLRYCSARHLPPAQPLQLQALPPLQC